MTRTRLCTTLALLLPLSAACSDDGGDVPDAAVPNIDAVVPDAMVIPACIEFETPAGTISGAPSMFQGNTIGEGANMQVAEGVCDVELDYFAQAGDDQVVAVTGLTDGVEYVARVASIADYAVYVATGCTEEAGGPAAGECLSFADETLAGEIAAFTAPADGNVFVVIDQFNTAPSPHGEYTLEIFEPECAEDTDCTDPDVPFCSNRLCVACNNSFDCSDPTAPACDGTQSCVVGYGDCVGDDAVENQKATGNSDDGPAGASELMPMPGTPAIVDAGICGTPAAESDWYRMTVAQDDDRLIILNWGTASDLDLELFSADGELLMDSYFSQPEVINAADLDEGDYYVAITQFQSVGVTDVEPYTLTVSVPECVNSFECLDPGLPLCDNTGTCAVGPDECMGDDTAGEAGDDGPAGAVDVTPPVGEMTTTNSQICNTPATESDFFVVNTEAGDNIDIEVSWSDGVADLDVAVASPNARLMGLTYWRNPEIISLTHLPAGPTYIQITYFGAPVTASVDYTLNVSRSAGGCSTVADCAAEFENQMFRGVCNASVCEFVDGQAEVENGELCDSNGDCMSNRCSYIAFQSRAETSVCSVGCIGDAQCEAALGAGYTCTTPFQSNFCRPACTENTDCGSAQLGGSSNLDPDLPWDYLTCNGGGACGM